MRTKLNISICTSSIWKNMEKDKLTWNRKGENEWCVDMSGHGKKRNVGQFVN